MRRPPAPITPPSSDALPPSLTVLRFVPAIYVVTYHFLDAESLSPSVQRSLGYGQIAVTFFFVLSGFLLAYHYLGEVRPRPMKFLINRAARLGPLYLLAWIAMAPIVLFVFAQAGPDMLREQVSWRCALVTLFGLQAWSSSYILAWNSPAWSLSAEFFFYLVFALLLMRRAAPPAWRVRGLVALFVLRVGLVAGAAWLPPQLVGLDPNGTPLPALSLVYSPLFRLPDFLIGVSLGRLFRARDPRHDRRVARWGTVAAGAALIATLGLLPSSWYERDYFADALAPVLFLPALVLIIYAVACAPTRTRLSSRSLVLLGESSYAIYILQVPVLAWARVCRGSVEFGAAQPKSFVCYIALLVTVSVLAHLWIEQPTRAWLRSRFAG